MKSIQLINLISEQLITRGNLEIIDTSYSPNYCAHSGKITYRGIPFLKRYAKEIHKALANLRVEKIEILSESEQRISWLRTLSGKHVFKMRGIPPSNKKIIWYEMIVSRFEKNKIVEEWIVSDLAAQLLLKTRPEE